MPPDRQQRRLAVQLLTLAFDLLGDPTPGEHAHQVAHATTRRATHRAQLHDPRRFDPEIGVTTSQEDGW